MKCLGHDSLILMFMPPKDSTVCMSIEVGLMSEEPTTTSEKVVALGMGKMVLKVSDRVQLGGAVSASKVRDHVPGKPMAFRNGILLRRVSDARYT